MSSSRANQTKFLLIAGIIVAGGLSIFLHLKIAQQRDDAAEAAQDHATARANRAMLNVERATINREYPKARKMLAIARAAVDEAIAERPDNAKLARSRLVIIRRQAQIAQHLEKPKEAARLAKEAVEVAAQIFRNNPTDERTRHDRLTSAREFAQASDDALVVVDILRGAAVAVDDSTKFLPANGPVEAQLAGVWIDLAKREAALKRTAHALAAAKRAVQVAQSARKGQGDPVTTASLAYDVVATAVHIAHELKQPVAHEEFQRDAVRLLEFRARLAPNDLIIPQALAARYGRLADQVFKKKSPEAAKAFHDKAVALMRPLLDAHPTNDEVRLAYVRTINDLGAYYSTLKKDRKALKAYKLALTAATPLEKIGLRTRLITMGNYAQLLGRLDKIRPARAAAREAYALAQTLSTKEVKDRRAREDQTSAGLRYARLLRATPGARRRQARGIAQAERERLVLDSQPTPRQESLKRGLDTLIRELR